jgi:hypothetical protein
MLVTYSVNEAHNRILVPSTVTNRSNLLASSL